MAYFYEAGAIEATWGLGEASLNLSTGWKSLSFTPNSERVTTDVSADGKYAFSKMGDKGCTISITLQQTNPLNKKIAQAHAIQDIVGATLPIAPFKIVDPTGDSVHFLALNAVLTEVAANEFAEASGDKTWVWVAESYLQAEDPATITAALSSYLK